MTSPASLPDQQSTPQLAKKPVKPNGWVSGSKSVNGQEQNQAGNGDGSNQVVKDINNLAGILTALIRGQSISLEDAQLLTEHFKDITVDLSLTKRQNQALADANREMEEYIKACEMDMATSEKCKNLLIKTVEVDKAVLTVKDDLIVKMQKTIDGLNERMKEKTEELFRERSAHQANQELLARKSNAYDFSQMENARLLERGSELSRKLLHNNLKRQPSGTLYAARGAENMPGAGPQQNPDQAGTAGDTGANVPLPALSEAGEGPGKAMSDQGSEFGLGGQNKMQVTMADLVKLVEELNSRK